MRFESQSHDIVS